MGVILLHFITSGGTAYQGTTRDLFYMVLAANWHLQENLIMTELEEVVHFNFENVMKEHKELSINSEIFLKTSQELRMLSSVTLNCQVTMIVKKSSSQLSEM